jgi:hypothetical protein
MSFHLTYLTSWILQSEVVFIPFILSIPFIPSPSRALKLSVAFSDWQAVGGFRAGSAGATPRISQANRPSAIPASAQPLRNLSPAS